jgi:hypothetical protein
MTVLTVRGEALTAFEWTRRARVVKASCPLPTEEEIARMLVGRLRWRTAEGFRVPIRKYSARVELALQLGQVRQARTAAYVRFEA